MFHAQERDKEWFHKLEIRSQRDPRLKKRMRARDVLDGIYNPNRDEKDIENTGMEYETAHNSLINVMGKHGI